MDQKKFIDGDVIVWAEFEDKVNVFRWRIIVQRGKAEPVASDWSSHYRGLLVFGEYALATAYWEGTLPIEMPFKLTQLASYPS